MAAAAGAGAGHHLKGQGSTGRPELKSRDRPNLEPARGCCLSILAQGSNQNFWLVGWGGVQPERHLLGDSWARCLDHGQACGGERGGDAYASSPVALALPAIAFHGTQAPQTRSRHAGPGQKLPPAVRVPPHHAPGPGSFGQPAPRRQAQAFSVRGALIGIVH